MQLSKFSLFAFLLAFQLSFSQKTPADYVNPFIGTSNFGATHPGAIAPRGMLSISPFNVSFYTKGIENPLEKDSRWLSNPYVNENTFLTGFTHVNMSGVGCPELGVIIAMPTTGKLETNHLKYGSTYKNEQASAGYYSTHIDKYNVKAEMTASMRAGVSRYHFPKGESNVLINLGLGLTNEQGAMVKIISPTEVQGVRMVGSFCYNSPELAYPVYFVAKLSKPADSYGVWHKPEKYEGVEAEWMLYNGKTRLKEGFTREVVGDSIGAYFRYKFDKEEVVEMKVGVSYVSIENARENLEKEIGNKSFTEVYEQTKNEWNKQFHVALEGGTDNQKTIFYTGLYHTLIHPHIFNDINGDYPQSSTNKIGKSNQRYTVFSLWDTYRNYHQLMTLLYPEQQLGMVRTMLDIYDESGWLPKWELNSTETFTMVGDPASIVLADTYLRGLTDFNIEKAYEAMLKGANTLKNNPIRLGVEEYWNLGYLSVDGGVAGPVSTTQEYNIADFAIAQLAKKLGKKKDFERFSKQSLSYRKLFDKQTKLLRPRHANGKWYAPFNPESGANFEKNVGYIEGNAWQYVYMVTHDVKGMMQMMGGAKAFEKQLDYIFDKGQYDMANEPDIAYPYLYNYIKGSEWKTQKRVHDLIEQYFQNKPAGLPGNEDTGVMSAWLIYGMMGFYPVSPGEPIYTFTSPKFNKITLTLDKKYYPNDELTIESNASPENIYIKRIFIDEKPYDSYFITHEQLKKAKKIRFELTNHK
ncbi:GH92 family glycosyl hydrolase [Capnocytophaga felis]|uniref:Alpha-1 2-mannosidase n=1 Tax=Capnocytophaga felis TaxID=2267611 RepID=A0A5M4B971_9FLAO|nr:GH92 family glycosyl hydrolase [Capnocytophaga felis]GET46164.1 alpha-1 2-mannosidase [Capnocytophaga felis]GET48955.1 alpha-1 2-mannosidase [Capnocytophaga felis]